MDASDIERISSVNRPQNIKPEIQFMAESPPPIPHASPILVNWGSRGTTWPMLIANGRVVSARCGCKAFIL